ncbi:hypothetical protein LJC22_01515 [Desulfosarcina sp. OttesenSCG-928-G10]|nr:hypothetical protein [Desulfosarcina sp. OttesenSCG-928-G10]MDL2320886.1 hypothetical protein [Desulfosarcina sp. OttesenSCG-928-B08]
MAKGSISQKKLREPDRFMRFSQNLIALGHQHIKPILIGFGALLVIALVWTVTHQMKAATEREASAKLATLMTTYSAALGRNVDPKAALASVSAEFSAFFTEYGNTRSGQLARIDYGDICYRAGDADGAIASYTLAENAVGQEPAVKALIRSGLGYAHSLKKNYAEAARYFEMIAGGPDPTLKDDAVFNLAQIYGITGEKEKEAVMVNRLLTEFSGSLYTALLKEQHGN